MSNGEQIKNTFLEQLRLASRKANLLAIMNIAGISLDEHLTHIDERHKKDIEQIVDEEIQDLNLPEFFLAKFKRYVTHDLNKINSLEASHINSALPLIAAKSKILLLWANNAAFDININNGKTDSNFILLTPFVINEDVSYPYLSKIRNNREKNKIIPVLFNKEGKIIVNKQANPHLLDNVNAIKFINWLNSKNARVDLKIENIQLNLLSFCLRKKDAFEFASAAQIEDIKQALDRYENILKKAIKTSQVYKDKIISALRISNNLAETWDKLDEKVKKDILSMGYLHFGRLKKMLRMELDRISGDIPNKDSYVYILGQEHKIKGKSSLAKENLRRFLREKQSIELAKLLKRIDEYVRQDGFINHAIIWDFIFDSGVNKILSKWQIIKLANIIHFYASQYNYVRQFFRKYNILTSGVAANPKVIDELLGTVRDHKSDAAKELMLSGLRFIDNKDVISLLALNQNVFDLLAYYMRGRKKGDTNVGGLAIPHSYGYNPSSKYAFTLINSQHASHTTLHHERAHQIFACLREASVDYPSSIHGIQVKNDYKILNRMQNEILATMYPFYVIPGKSKKLTKEKIAEILHQQFVKPFGTYDYMFYRLWGKYALEYHEFEKAKGQMRNLNHIARHRFGAILDKIQEIQSNIKLTYKNKDTRKELIHILQGILSELAGLKRVSAVNKNNEFVEVLDELSDRLNKLIELLSYKNTEHINYHTKVAPRYVKKFAALFHEYKELAPYILLVTAAQDLEYFLKDY